MKDFINIGSSPSAEDCVQLGTENYSQIARTECNRLIALLRRIHGDEPEGASLRIMGFNHDFGRYYEVVCHYDTEKPESEEYAFKCENLPDTWEPEVC
jgi:hypothetical protein